MLEYVGRGKSLIDVGLAQAKTPLSTRSHYFEIEIMDPGNNCYIAIGLARKDYPRNRAPGWNKGSIAYHADDGKVSKPRTGAMRKNVTSAHSAFYSPGSWQELSCPSRLAL